MKMMTITDFIKFVIALDYCLNALNIIQNSREAPMHINGNIHARIILTKAGLVVTPLSLTKQSILRIIWVLYAMIDMASRNFIMFASHDRLYD